MCLCLRMHVCVAVTLIHCSRKAVKEMFISAAEKIHRLFVQPASLRVTHFLCFYTHTFTHTRTQSSKGNQAESESLENDCSVREYRKTLNLTLTRQKAVCKKKKKR